MQQKSPVIPRQCGQATVMITSILVHPILTLAEEQFGIKKLHSKRGQPATSELTRLLYKEDFTANRRFQINSLLNSCYQERDTAGMLYSGMHSKTSFAQQKQTNAKGVKTDRPPAGHCCPPLCGDSIPWSVTCSEGVSGSGGWVIRVMVTFSSILQHGTNHYSWCSNSSSVGSSSYLTTQALSQESGSLMPL